MEDFLSWLAFLKDFIFLEDIFKNGHSRDEKCDILKENFTGWD